MSEIFLKPLTFFKAHPNNAEIYDDSIIEDDLYLSIQEHGVIQPLVTLEDGTVLSGHRRLARSKRLKLEHLPVMIAQPKDDDPLAVLEIMLEYNRYRVKSSSELYKEALAYQTIITRKKGQGRTTNQIAKMIGMGSGRQLERLTYVMQNATPDMIKRIDERESSVSGVYEDLIQLKKEPEVIREQAREKLESGSPSVKAAIQEVKAEEKQKRVRKASSKAFEPPYDFINCLPNWDYSEIGRNHPGPKSWMNPIAPVMDAQALADYSINGIPMSEIGSDNGMLVLWVPSELTELGVPVLQSWGYEFTCKLFWCKEFAHEVETTNLFKDHVLEAFIGTRSQFTPTYQSNWFGGSAEPGCLPEYFYALIDQFGFDKKLEMFVSKQRNGYDYHG